MERITLKLKTKRVYMLGQQQYLYRKPINLIVKLKLNSKV